LKRARISNVSKRISNVFKRVYKNLHWNLNFVNFEIADAQLCGTNVTNHNNFSVVSSTYKANEVGGACGTHGRGEKSVQGFGGKARRKETTGKTKAWVGRWDQNGS
jgi:hypothetical protein